MTIRLFLSYEIGPLCCPACSGETKAIGRKTVPYVEFTLKESQLGDDKKGFPIVDQGRVPRSTEIPALDRRFQ
jgi:hypothetical protein